MLSDICLRLSTKLGSFQNERKKGVWGMRQVHGGIKI